MHGPPRLERGVQPILDRLWLELIQPEGAPGWDDVLIQVEGLFITCRLRDVKLASELSRLVQLRCLPEGGDPGGGYLRRRDFYVWCVQFC